MSEDKIEIRHIAPRLRTFIELVDSILHYANNLDTMKREFNSTLESVLEELFAIIKNGWKRERESEE